MSSQNKPFFSVLTGKNPLGACCYCSVSDGFAGTAPQIFCTQQEAQDFADINSQYLQYLKTIYEDSGYECITIVEPEIYPDLSVDENGQPQNCDGNGLLATGGSIEAVCCGVIDNEAEPNGGFIYPCIQGPERACEDNVSAEECSSRCNGVHHPDKTCAEEPCSEICNIECWECVDAIGPEECPPGGYTYVDGPFFPGFCEEGRCFNVNPLLSGTSDVVSCDDCVSEGGVDRQCIVTPEDCNPLP